MSNPAALVVLHSISKLYATKRFRWEAERVIASSYGKERDFRVQVGALTGFGHLVRCLEHLTTRPYAFVIRGEPLPATNLECTRRLLHDGPETGEVATFAEEPRHWFAV